MLLPPASLFACGLTVKTGALPGRWVTNLLLAAAVLTPAVGVVQAADAPKGERYALLVGVREYSEAKELRPLPYAEADVGELAQALRDNGYKADNVVLLTQVAGLPRFAPNKKRILKELRLLLAGRGEGDTVLLGFAGHGVKFKDDDASYFCPADAELDDKDSLLSVTEIYRQLEGCKAGLKVLLVDACRNEPLTGGTRAPVKIDLDSVTRPPAPTPQGGVAAFFSCSEKEKAYESEGLKHGVFFHYVIEALRSGTGVDDDDVTVLGLGDYVSKHVRNYVRTEYGAAQTPELTNSSRGSATLVATTADVRALRRGSACLDRKDYGRAVEEFTKAIRLNPKSAAAFNSRGFAYRRSGENDKGIADYDLAIQIDPNYAVAFNNRGVAYGEMGSYDQAFADLTHAIRLDPANVSAFYNRASIRIVRKEYDAAIADCGEAVKLDPKAAAAFYFRGWAWHKKGDADKALADYNEAVRLDPNYPLPFNSRGNLHSERMEYDAAVADYTEAIRLDPNYAAAFRGRGATLAAKKEYDKAIADYTEATVIEPRNPLNYKRRGQAYHDKGDQVNADADLKKVKVLEKK